MEDANGVIPVIADISRQGVTLNEQQIKDVVNAHHEFHIELFFFENLPITDQKTIKSSTFNMELPKFDFETKIWHGAVTEYPFGQKSFQEVAYENLMKNLEHVCQISDDSGEIYTYKKVLKSAISLANNLKLKFNIHKGDRVIVFMDHHHYLLPTWFGVTLAGGVLCPYEFTHEVVKEEVLTLIDQMKPSLLITSEGKNFDIFEEVFRELNLNVKILTYRNKIERNFELKDLLEDKVDFKNFNLPKIEDPKKEIFALALSSSTTGKAKLIRISHRQLLMFSVVSVSDLRIATTMRPGWHTITGITMWILVRKLTLITCSTFSIDHFLEMLEKYKVDVAFVKPKDIFAAIKSETIKKVSLDSLKLMSSSGEHLSDKICKEMQNYLKNGIVGSIYGMTDIGGILTTLAYGKIAPKSVGKIAQNVLMKIVDTNTGENLPPGEIGEIYAKFLYADFAGYYKKSDLTEASRDEDGFFKTEDMGFVNKDGDVFLVERKKFLISYRGEWINQKVIEHAVLDKISGCAGVCCVNIEDDVHGEIPVVAVIAENNKNLNEEEIIKVVKESHPFQFETKIMFFDSLPMTISSKYRKYLVRNLVLERMRDTQKSR
ncbi:uncharacterized protein LOC134833439 [Culicoides brevitarsis]|uniref:uncharacterized protein LOC134833439 n=1 Tax=Culicoides brevitarsis TaxID=469753 RepID=UPI00307BB444